MTEKQFKLANPNSSFLDMNCGIKDGDRLLNFKEVVDLLNALHEENEQLKEALKNSYFNEICEKCKYGNYFKTDNFIGGFEWDFECTKKHFGNDHWKCDGLTECDDFELKIKGDVE